MMHEYRNQGWAKKLVQLAQKKYKSIMLTTGKKSNPASKYLYKKLGFEVVGEKGSVKYWYWKK